MRGLNQEKLRVLSKVTDGFHQEFAHGRVVRIEYRNQRAGRMFQACI